MISSILRITLLSLIVVTSTAFVPISTTNPVSTSLQPTYRQPSSASSLNLFGKPKAPIPKDPPAKKKATPFTAAMFFNPLKNPYIVFVYGIALINVLAALPKE